MCGIIGYIGSKNATPILLAGLKRLEYRGYDSAGLCVLNTTGSHCLKSPGRISCLVEKLSKHPLPKSNIGIGHTRWATHGEANEKNAHPQANATEEIYVVHNGIIENYKELKKELEAEGVKFSSDTDTEVIPNLIACYHQTRPLAESVAEAVKRLRGAFGIVAVSKKEPETIIVARRSSPLLVGIGTGEHFVASDASALLGHTREVVYLNDDELAILTPDNFTVRSVSGRSVTKIAEKIDWSETEAKQEGYPHFMLKEINEGANAVTNAIRGRLITKNGNVKLGGLDNVATALQKLEQLHIVSGGTSYYAGLAGGMMIEEYAKIPVTVTQASEFRYRDIPMGKNSAILAISQSGETADTLAAIREAKIKGHLTLGIVNVVGSTMARETDAGIYNHAGPEIGVASTKAYLSQLTILALLAIYLGRSRTMSVAVGQRITEALKKLPQQISTILAMDGDIKKIAEKYSTFKNFLYLGRKYNYPTALEGALKLKEISYCHAEAYPGGELKHGPIALIDKNMPVIAVALKDSVYEKMVSNIEEIKARQGPIIAITSPDDKELKTIANDIIEVPKTLEMLSPILSIVPLHLLAYHLAVKLGRDIDHPRNLAKSVTVE